MVASCRRGPNEPHSMGREAVSHPCSPDVNKRRSQEMKQSIGRDSPHRLPHADRTIAGEEATIPKGDQGEELMKRTNTNHGRGKDLEAKLDQGIKDMLGRGP